MNLEQAQAKILELQDELKTIKEVADTHKQNNEILTQRNQELQEHNQKLFLRVTQSTQTESEGKEEELTIDSFLETVEL